MCHKKIKNKNKIFIYYVISIYNFIIFFKNFGIFCVNRFAYAVCLKGKIIISSMLFKDI